MTDQKKYSVERGNLRTPLVLDSKPVNYTVLLPPSYDSNRQEVYPLLLFLHGGGGSEEDMVNHLKPIIELESSALIRMAEFVAVSFHCSSTDNVSGGGHYVDSVDGENQWQRFILETLLPHVYGSYHVGNSQSSKLFVTGISMGGVGALRLALRHPQQVKAVAALEPFMDAALSLKSRSSLQRALDTSFNVTSNRVPAFLDSIINSAGSSMDFEWLGLGWDKLRTFFHGTPVDETHWKNWHPACIVKNNAEAIKASGIQIRVECGDCDEYELQYAAELLHRTLLNADIVHEYHMVRGGGHMSLDLYRRLYCSMLFLSNVVLPPLNTTDLGEMQQQSEGNDVMSRIASWQVQERKKEAGYIDEAISVKYADACKSFNE